MKMIKPQGNRILVQPMDAPKTSAGGILIPEAHRAESDGLRRGRVVAIGNGGRNEDGVREPIEGVSEGDVIAWSGNFGVDVDMRGEQFVLVGVDAVVGVVED